MSDIFRSFPKLTTWHSHPRHATVSRVCVSEKAGRAWQQFSKKNNWKYHWVYLNVTVQSNTFVLFNIAGWHMERTSSHVALQLSPDCPRLLLCVWLLRKTAPPLFRDGAVYFCLLHFCNMTSPGLFHLCADGFQADVLLCLCALPLILSFWKQAKKRLQWKLHPCLPCNLTGPS